MKENSTPAVVVPSCLVVKCALGPILVLVLASLSWAQKPGEHFFALAREADKKGDTVQAYLLSHQAVKEDAANPEFRRLRDHLRARVLGLSRSVYAPEPDADAGRYAAVTGSVSPGELQEARAALPPPKLRPKPGPRDFDLRGEPKALIEQVAKAFGLDVVFERDYQPAPAVRFQVTGLEFRECARALELATNSFVVPISETTILISRDNLTKRQELQPVMAMAVALPPRLSVQDAQEIVTQVQQVFEMRRFSVDPQRRMIFMRDSVNKVIAAKRLVEQLSYRAQVDVAVDLISVSKTSSLSVGVNLQSAAPLINFGSTRNVSFSPPPAGFTNFLTWGGGLTFVGIGITTASMLFNHTDTSTETLIQAEIRALDGQAATLHVGDKYPITTVQYVGNTSGGGQVFAPPPTINFEDLGVIIKVTPAVHAGGEVTLDLESEFKVLGQLTPTGIPSISSRKYTGKVRLKTGESAVVAGLVNISDIQTKTGIPGLTRLPFLRQNQRDRQNQDLLLVLRPRLTHLPAAEFPVAEIWLGSETRPLSAF